MTLPPPSHSATVVRPDPAKIIVPRKHGQVLVEPGFGVMVEAITPKKEPGEKIKIHGFSLWGLGAIARRELWGALLEHAKAIGQPLSELPAAEDRWVFTGHQVEFYHAGVWAKVIAADELAKRATAAGVRTHAFDLLVDHDTLDHLGFDVPVQRGETWKRTMVEWEAATALPADSLKVPTLTQFEEWDSELASHPQSQTDAMAVVLSALRAGLGGEGYVTWMSGARAKLEAAIGIAVHHVPVGLLCAGETWRQFVRAWVENADTWGEAYNRHLAAYRKRQGIKNEHHPMPDLMREDVRGGWGVARELPFWIYRKGEARQRLMVLKAGGRVMVLHNGVEHELDSNFRLQDLELMIRPRALTLTMYVRLFLADLFIHGIGGALYDQITDGLMEELFGVAPPYACVSAAWLLPLGQPLESREDADCLTSERHHLLHNPQLGIDPFTALKTEVAERITERRRLVEAIAASLRERRKEGRAERREWFERLHAVNGELHALAPGVLRKLDREIADCLRAREQNKVLLWREFYVGLHTMESLRGLIGRVRGA